jgi:Fe-S cluster assembly iron-binding protein IscA
MLLLTENASTIVKTIAEQAPDISGSENHVGLRIAAEAVDSTELSLAVVPEPESTDQIIETDGALVYLEPNAVVMLADKVLDAQVEENGSVSFAIALQQTV